jgi:hypothetical protein
VRTFFEQSAGRPRRERLAELRRFHFSLDENHRSEALALLAESPDADAARELVELYRECEWRSTRLEILRILGDCDSSRSLEFLLRVASESGDDLPLAEAALRALGRTRHPFAARALARLYPTATPSLRPVLAEALAGIGDRSQASLFETELDRAIKECDAPLASALCLALGELKQSSAETKLFGIAAQGKRHPLGERLALSALVALGRLSRKAEAFESLEPAFRHSALESQLFQSALQQVRLRGQWSLEDYLAKLFESPSYHPHLPLELNTFPSADLREALTLFEEERYASRLLKALPRLDAALASELIAKRFVPSSVKPEVRAAVLDAAARVGTSALAALVESFRSVALSERAASPEAFEAWLDALTLVSADPLPALAALLADESLEAAARISAINRIVLHGFTLGRKRDGAGKVLTQRLAQEKDPALQARLLRALAQLGHEDDKATAFAKASLKQAALSGSALSYFERVPSKKALAVLSEVAGSGGLAPALVLRALEAQSDSADTPALDAFFTSCLATSAPPDVRIAALSCLAKHPREKLLADTEAALKADERLQLAAIIALKSFAREETGDVLAPFLKSAHPSLAGRALDAILALPGLRPKRLALEFLDERPLDLAACDKIARCLEAPESGGDRFPAMVEAILAKHPDHPLRDSLVDLRDRLASRKRASAAGAVGPDVVALDTALRAELPAYARLDDSVKSALRSAELPFLRSEFFQGTVDKASSVLEYCKSLDLFLEKHLGRELLFPRLEQRLHEFQSLLHAVGLNEENATAQKVLDALELGKSFTAASFPLHKAQIVARGFLSGKILQERFKVVDGLRAWALLLLLFSRKLARSGGKALVPLRGMGDEQVVAVAKRLMALQDIRNPAAHRQTFLDFVGVEEVRREVLKLLIDLPTALTPAP